MSKTLISPDKLNNLIIITTSEGKYFNPYLQIRQFMLRNNIPNITQLRSTVTGIQISTYMTPEPLLFYYTT